MYVSVRHLTIKSIHTKAFCFKDGQPEDRIQR